MRGWVSDPKALGPMEPSGFRQVIEGAAQRAGLRLEPGLIEALVANTKTAYALPLLAFTLEQYATFSRLQDAVQRKSRRHCRR